MKEGRPRFDIDSLRALAGEKAFARGEAYYRGDQVRLLTIEPARVLAEVAGTEDYRTELKGRSKQIGGTCSCPAFEDWGFCKHMVATALAANAAGDDAGVQDTDILLRIRDHLKNKGIDALVEMIVDLAEHDPALFRRLDMAAAAVDADDKTLEKRLRRSIDDATRTGGFIEYRQAAGWAAHVDSVLDSVADLASGQRAALALGLAERAIDRIERAVENMDDSDGHCSALLHRARDIHLTAACAVRPDPVQLARQLFAREMQGEYEMFANAAEIYADALGKEGLAEYRRLAAEAWEKLPPLLARARGHPAHPDGYVRLRGILDFFAEHEGDLDARIALRAKDLSSAWRYLQLAEFCRAQGREEEALRHAEEGLWVFADDRLDERLVFLAADLLLKAGRRNDAEAHLWQAFERQPSLDLYGRLRKLGGDGARQRAVELLTARLAKKERGPWYNPADLLIHVLQQEKMFEVAWRVAREHGASTRVTEALAKASEAVHPREALEVYVKRVDQLAGTGGNAAYTEAVEFIARMATLRSAAGQAAYIAALKTRYGRKRNF